LQAATASAVEIRKSALIGPSILAESSETRERLGSVQGSLVLLLVLAACRVEIGPPERPVPLENTEEGEKPSGKITIYTSMYRPVIEQIEPLLKRELPQVEVEWLQAGSEKIATRLDAELAAGAPRADLVMTSDPLWYERLWREGHLLPHASLRALAMPRELVHAEGAFVTSRISTMVIAYNERAVKAEEAPQSFAELFSERWSGKVTIPDPLGSGTAFTTLAFLVARDDRIMERMKAARTVASGGNTTAITRLESGEHAVGFVLLENVLMARQSGSPLAYRVPREGAVLIPGPIAILKKSPNPRAARAVYDLILSQPAQQAIVRGAMHSPFEGVSPPEGAPAIETLLQTEYRWTPEFVARAWEESHALRTRFSEVMGGS
jgi:iron(III) transport system substrate-binding protein